jgi:tetratricopeptide (TPR) repeat protein
VQTASIDDLFDDFDPLDDFSPLSSHGEQALPAFETPAATEPGLRTATGFDFEPPSGAESFDAGYEPSPRTATGFDFEAPSVPGLDFGFPEEGSGGVQGEGLTGLDVLDFIDDSLGTSRAGESVDVLDFVDGPPGAPPVAAPPAAPAPHAAPAAPRVARIPQQEAALPPMVGPKEAADPPAKAKPSRGAARRIAAMAAVLLVVAGGGAWMFFGVGGSTPAPRPAPPAAPPAKAETAAAAPAEQAAGAEAREPAGPGTAPGAAPDGVDQAAAPEAAQGTAQEAAPEGADQVAAPEAAEESHLARGRALEEAGQGREALAAYRAALDAQEGAPGEAHHRASVVLLSLGEGMRSYLEAKRAVGADETSVEFRLQLAAAAMESGRAREALDAYKEALALRPGDPTVQEGLGRLLITMGTAREAIGTLEPLVRGDTAPPVRLVLGEAYLQVGAWARAAATLEPIRDRDAAAYLLARAFLEQGQSAQALPYLLRAVELSDTEDVALRHLGYVYKELRKRREAVAAFRAYLKRVPDAVDRAEIEDEIGSLTR